jgi:hypothetical protein
MVGKTPKTARTMLRRTREELRVGEQNLLGPIAPLSFAARACNSSVGKPRGALGRGHLIGFPKPFASSHRLPGRLWHPFEPFDEKSPKIIGKRLIGGALTLGRTAFF